MCRMLSLARAFVLQSWHDGIGGFGLDAVEGGVVRWLAIEDAGVGGITDAGDEVGSKGSASSEIEVVFVLDFEDCSSPSTSE